MWAATSERDPERDLARARRRTDREAPGHKRATQCWDTKAGTLRETGMAWSLLKTPPVASPSPNMQALDSRAGCAETRRDWAAGHSPHRATQWALRQGP